MPPVPFIGALPDSLLSLTRMRANVWEHSVQRDHPVQVMERRCTSCAKAACLLMSWQAVSGSMQVSQGFAAWAVHWCVLKALMYALGTSNAIPFLELLAYAGYTFVPICFSLLARLSLGEQPLRVDPLVVCFCGLCHHVVHLSGRLRASWARCVCMQIRCASACGC